MCVFFQQQNKCVRYWPDPDRKIEKGKLTVTYISEQLKEDYDLREFALTNKDHVSELLAGILFKSGTHCVRLPTPGLVEKIAHWGLGCKHKASIKPVHSFWGNGRIRAMIKVVNVCWFCNKVICATLTLTTPNPSNSNSWVCCNLMDSVLYCPDRYTL